MIEADVSIQWHEVDPDFYHLRWLMPIRVENVLFVGKPYESFLLHEEDSSIERIIAREYKNMGLSNAPRVLQVSSGLEAIDFIKTHPVDLVIAVCSVDQSRAPDLARAVKQIRPNLPIVVLIDDLSDLTRQPGPHDRPNVERIFVWNGDAKILLAIIKLIEDQLNVEHDIRIGDIRVILLIENSAHLDSTCLPLIYSELVKFTHSLMAEVINPKQRLLNMRTRPKILLSETFEEAWQLYSKYSDNVLGVITDIRFPHYGRLDPQAGLEFTRLIKENSPDTPVLVQSSDAAQAERAVMLGASFLNKKSTNFLQELRAYLQSSLGLGDFEFALPDGAHVGRAHDLRTFEDMIRKIPDDSLYYHASHNHFSSWLVARTEFELATRIRPKKATDFAAVDEIRQYLLGTLADFRERREVAQIELRARTLVGAGAYRDARSLLVKARRIDPERKDRLADEFGFLYDFNASAEADQRRQEAEPERLRWRQQTWRVLAESNHFELGWVDDLTSKTYEELREPPARSESVPSKEMGTALSVAKELPFEQRGEQLERAIVALFGRFSQIADADERVDLKKLRQQKRGTQDGYDISFECVLRLNEKVSCHIECKDRTRISLEDVAHKLLAEQLNASDIRHWILISPRANPSNLLNSALEAWQVDSPFPFEVQVWCPETGVDEFFGLSPEIYDLYFKPEDPAAHPNHWDTEKITSVFEKWKARLAPPLRLPPGWSTYCKDPALLCLMGEQHQAFGALFNHYVPLDAKNKAGVLTGRSMEQHVREWLKDPETPTLLLLDEFGDGKTFFTYVLARKLVAEFREDSNTGWIPLRLSLRNLASSANGQEFVCHRLRQFGADLAGWKQLIASKRVLVILDGFDEMSKQLDPATVTKNIKALVECCREFEGAKVLITSRTHFFENRRDKERVLLQRLHNPLVLRLAPIPRKDNLTHLREFAAGPQQMDILAKLSTMHDPIGLCSKPLFLDMLKSTIHDLPDPLDQHTLYQTYVHQSLCRKVEQLEDDGLDVLPSELPDHLMTILEQLALELQVSESEFISLKEYAQENQRSYAELLWKMTSAEQDTYEQDAMARVGIRSLLSRAETPEANLEWTVGFCHRSIKEYLVARGVYSAFANDDIEEAKRLLEVVPLSHEVLDFVAHMMRHEKSTRWSKYLLQIIPSVTSDQAYHRLGGNAATILYRVTGELPGRDWSRRVLDHADLAGANLSQKDFSHSTLRHANLDNVTLENTDFRYCDLTGIRIEETTSVASLALHPSGDRLLAAYGDGTIREWEISPGTRGKVRTVHRNAGGPVSSMAVLPDDQVGMQVGHDYVFLDLEVDGALTKRALFPIKLSSGWLVVGPKTVLVARKNDDRTAEVLLVGLEGQEVLASFGVTGTPRCASLGDQALVDDNVGGLRVMTANPKHAGTQFVLEAHGVSSLSALHLGEERYLVACGQGNGQVRAWEVTHSSLGWDSRVLFSRRVHDGLVSAVVPLDEDTLVTGGEDRRICITRLGSNDADWGRREDDVLHLTVRCAGLRIDGVKGPPEYAMLQQLLERA